MSKKSKDENKDKGADAAPPAAAATAVADPAGSPEAAAEAPAATAAPPVADPVADPADAPLREDGPTLEEYIAAGYTADTYPPTGYAAKSGPAGDPGLTLDDLRELGAVRSEAADAGSVDVLTKGGVALRFPGDEKKAGALTDVELFGVVDPPAPAETTQAADEQALLGNLTPTQRAMAHWGLEQRHVLGSGEKEQEDGSIEVVIVTAGGQKIRWPRDAARVLSDMEKGDAVPHAEPGGIFSK